MVTFTKVYKTYWYLSFQDGAVDNKKYETEKEAYDVYNKMSDIEKRGIYVTNRTVEL